MATPDFFLFAATAVSVGTTFETMLPPIQLSKTKYITHFFQILGITLKNVRKIPNSTHHSNQSNNNTPVKIQQCTNKVQYRHKQKLSVDVMLVKLAVVGVIVFSKVEGQTRAPRFHPREGVGNYRWPTPGDSDYRYARSINSALTRNNTFIFFAELTFSMVVVMVIIHLPSIV